MEYPRLQEIYSAQGGDDFVVLSVDNANRPELDSEFVKKVGATFPVLLDDKKIAREVYEIRGTPTNLLIDRQGKIVFRHLGFSPGQEKVLAAEVEALVKGTAL